VPEDPGAPAGRPVGSAGAVDPVGPGGGRVVEVIPNALDGERVDRAVALLTGLTRAEVTDLVDRGAVTIDERAVTVRGRRVRTGQRLAVDVPAAAPEVVLSGDDSVEFGVVFVDDDVIVVDKPAGLVVHPGAGNRTGTLVQGLLARFPDLGVLGDEEEGTEDRPGIVHRLDKGTSGLLIVARTVEARRSLVAQLMARDVHREYATVVIGAVEGDEGIIDAPLGRSGRDPTRISVDASGRDARTRYRVERRFMEPAPATLLECRLETGRTHQIRVHLAAIGHPVLGDERYGRDLAMVLGGWRPLTGARPFLHARRLAFTHPRHGDLRTFTSPLPADLLEVLDGLH
jgi:23S rRNA pseudouridine1911/1915/1917 synthase